MKIAILGATGPTGQALLRRALDTGHNVVALVRNPDGISTRHDNLQVEKTDITKEDTMIPALENCDVVMSCLGARGTFLSEVRLYSSSIPVIVSAMRKTNVKRFMCITSWGLKHEDGEPRVVSWLLRSLFLKTIYADMARMEDYLESECQDINYTVVRPPSLTNSNSTDKEIKAREGQYISNGGWSIPRTDVAKFMLNCLDTDKWDRKKVEKTDITKEDTMIPALENCDVVMSCLGARGTFLSEVRLYSSSIPVIVSAMRKTNVKRFMCITSWGLKHEDGEPRVVSWLLRSLFLKTIYADMARMEDYLESECQDINYTVVRPPSLTNSNSTDKEIKAREGQYISNGGWSIPRTDVAKFMLNCLDTDKWDRKKVAISV